jgi:hypothetical protein
MVSTVQRFVAAFFLTLAPTWAAAQCNLLSGNPAPTTEPYGANLVLLKYLASGPGFGDDKPEIQKSTFMAPGFPFDPATTHSVDLTIRKNNISGPIMWNTTIPPSTTLWTATTLVNGNVRWRYNDPSATFLVKKAQIIQGGPFLPGFYVWTYIRGTNSNIANAPVIPLVDQAHLTVQIANGGVGICYDGVTTACTGSGNTQRCRV